MKVVVQRCKDAKCVVDNKITGSVKDGLMVLVGFTQNDSIKEIEYLCKKIVNLRIFDDESGIMNKSILDVGGSILSISQFTLYANTKKGNRPSYIEALRPEEATKLYDLFNKKISAIIPTKFGVFGADMLVTINNVGPTTIMLEK